MKYFSLSNIIGTIKLWFTIKSKILELEDELQRIKDVYGDRLDIQGDRLDAIQAQVTRPKRARRGRERREK